MKNKNERLNNLNCCFTGKIILCLLKTRSYTCFTSIYSLLPLLFRAQGYTNACDAVRADMENCMRKKEGSLYNYSWNSPYRLNQSADCHTHVNKFTTYRTFFVNETALPVTCNLI